MKLREVIWAFGHTNVLSTHKTTFEVTKDSTLSKQGNCIIAVKATKSAADLDTDFKKLLKKEGIKLNVFMETNCLKEVIKASGSSRLTFTNTKDIVIRKSNFVCARTVAIKANKAACEFSRDFVNELKNPNQKVKITLELESY